MANDKSVAGYKITVSGEYFSKDLNTGVKSVKYYDDMVFELPEIVSYVEGREEVEKIVDGRAVTTSRPKVIKGNASRCGLHVIRRYHIEHTLKDSKKFPDFTGVKTCRIFSKERIMIAPQKELTPSGILKMTESEIRQFVMLNDINLELSQFGDFGDMKNAVIRAYNQKIVDDKAAGKTADTAKEDLALSPSIDMAETETAFDNNSDLF